MEETPKEGPNESQELSSFWCEELRLAEKYFEKYWERCDKILKRYEDQRDTTGNSAARYNVFWANVETQKPAVLAQIPSTYVERRFRDRSPIGKHAATLLERATQFQIESQDVLETLFEIRDDFLLFARGQAWVRYEPFYQESFDEMGQPFTRVVYEQAPVDYIHRRDFMHSPARRWKEVRWTSRTVYMTRDDAIARFGEEIGKALPLDFVPEHLEKDQAEKNDQRKQARVYEIWDKTKKQVLWVSREYKGGILDRQNDPLGLKGFFPCPKPLFGTLSRDSTIPIPDFVQYQDLAAELDNVTERIKQLTKALRVAAIGDGSIPELARLLDESTDNKVILSDNWMKFQQQAGLKGSLDFLPLDSIAQVLVGLYDSRDRLLKQIYEVTGMSDIIRGQSDARETYGAQRIKSQYATMRLSERQRTVQRFIRDVVAIVAEIVAEHFQYDTLKLIAGDDVVAEMGEEGCMAAFQLLRDDRLRTFTIEIETDSTIQPDEQAEQESRTKYAEMIGGYLGNMVQLASVAPSFGPYFGELLLFVTRGFKAGRNLESTLEAAVEQANARLKESLAKEEQEPPDPEMVKAQTQAQVAQMQLQLDQQRAEFEATLEAQKMQFEQAMRQQEVEANYAIEMAKLQAENELKMARFQSDSQIKREAAMVRASQPRVVQNGARP